MASQFQEQLSKISSPALKPLLKKIQRGIEKECLRIQTNGKLAQTPHSESLGSALTHPHITTDFSEALLEFITPVSTDIDQCLQFLHDIHNFTYDQIGEEILWTSSMPCILEGDDKIPIARFGNSNVAQMKYIYRLGLGHRYGRLMQAIAGIHYNFSLPDEFWPLYQNLEGNKQNLQTFKTDKYFALIRNFRRHVWLLVYLFGASPAVCKSFLKGRQHQLMEIEKNSFGLPQGTALRMGDLGYQSSAQEKVYVSYDSLNEYAESLHQALTQSHQAYADIGVKVDGQYRQLNTNILQIENEYYSSIRPKRVTRSAETPINALCARGVEYIEVRCIDVNPYMPLGIDAEQVRFLDTFLLFCLLEDSPPSSAADNEIDADNLKKTVNSGREPGLMLKRNDEDISLKDWAEQLIQPLSKVAAVLDDAHQSDLYQSAVSKQLEKIQCSDKTPSASILADMQAQEIPYFRLAMQRAEQNQAYFRNTPLADSVAVFFRDLAKESLAKQRQIEAEDTLSFEQYLENYYSQYSAIGFKDAVTT